MSDLIKKSSFVGSVNLKTPTYKEPQVSVKGNLPDHINVVCVQSGVKYKEEYVEKLRNSVARNLSIPHTFTVLTDDCVSEEDVWGGWWSKINLFNPDYIGEGLTLYLDLDVVITGSLDEIVSMDSSNSMTIIKNFSINIRHCAYNSSAMLWWSGDPNTNRIYDEFKKDPQKVMKTLHGDQCWIWRTLKDNADVFPNTLIKSYKYDCTRGLPQDTRVVVFHGKPDPEDVNVGWVKTNWM